MHLKPSLRVTRQTVVEVGFGEGSSGGDLGMATTPYCPPFTAPWL